MKQFQAVLAAALKLFLKALKCSSFFMSLKRIVNVVSPLRKFKEIYERTVKLINFMNH